MTTTEVNRRAEVDTNDMLSRYRQAFADTKPDQWDDALQDLLDYVQRGGAVSPELAEDLVWLLYVRSQEAAGINGYWVKTKSRAIHTPSSAEGGRGFSFSFIRQGHHDENA
jgi:hypothetical protein